VQSALRLVLEVLNGAIRHGCSSSDVAADLGKLGVAAEVVAVVEEVWLKLGGDLTHRVASSTVLVNRLVDMTWTFGVTVATDEVASVGETFLQLRLVLATGSGGRENVYMELTLPQFFELYAELQRARTILDFLSSSST
jgi:hypothetical protein